jgi:hypothetical protein
MSTIVYYSNYCEHSKRLLQTLAKTGLQEQNMHFLCIDNRVEDRSDGNTYVVLENGSRILLPKPVTRVPAFFLVSSKQFLFGDGIYKHVQMLLTKQAENSIQSHKEPEAFSFGGNGGGSSSSASFGIMSDQFSYLDMAVDDYAAKGEGGMRQLHNYVTINNMDVTSSSSKPAATAAYFSKKSDGGISSMDESKIPSGVTIEQLQKMREQEFLSISKG